jgi:hypothetical protein
VVQPFHDADFFLQRLERVGCLGAEGAAPPAALRDLGEGASANFDGEESAAGVFAQFHLQCRGDAVQADMRRNMGLREGSGGRRWNEKQRLVCLTLPNEPLPRSLIGVYISLKPTDRALRALALLSAAAASESPAVAMSGKAKDVALGPGAQDNSRPSFVKCPFVDRALRAQALLSAAAASESPAVAMSGMGKDAALEPGATGEEMSRELLQPMLAHSLRWRFVCVSVETARLSAA